MASDHVGRTSLRSLQFLPCRQASSFSFRRRLQISCRSSRLGVTEKIAGERRSLRNPRDGVLGSGSNSTIGQSGAYRPRIPFGGVNVLT
jgi:hypothetical protein